MDGTIADATNLASGNTFAGGGTATFTAPNENTLEISRIAPGDKISFDIELTNQSNIKTKYRLKIEGKGKTFTTAEGEQKTDEVLLSALKTTIQENDGEVKVYEKLKLHVSEWRELDYNVTAISTLHITIEFPTYEGNEYQNRECSFVYSIEAVQSNAKTEDYAQQFGGNPGEPYVETLDYIYTAQDLYMATYNVQKGQGGTFIIAENATDPIRTQYLSVKPNGRGGLAYDWNIEGKNLTIDLNDHTLEMTNTYGQCAIIKNNATLSIKNGTVKATRATSYQPMFFVGGSGTGTAANVDTLELDNVIVDYKVDTSIEAVNNGWSTVISSNASNQNAKSDVTVNDTKINVTGPMLAAVYLPNKGTRTFNNCTIAGNRVSTSLFICGGDWNINGGSYVGNRYELGGDLSAANAAIQDEIIGETDEIWEGPKTIAGTNYPGGIVGYHNGPFGTGDAICIVNRGTENYQLGNININGAQFVIGDVALTGDALTNAAVGTSISGPSGYGVRIYDVKTNIGAISIKNINVISSKQVIKGETTNTEVVLPFINVITAAEDGTRLYNSCNEFKAPARGTAAN